MNEEIIVDQMNELQQMIDNFYSSYDWNDYDIPFVEYRDTENYPKDEVGWWLDNPSPRWFGDKGEFLGDSFNKAKRRLNLFLSDIR